MFLEHFKLSALPFENTPNPHFFFLGGKHREALAAMKYAVSAGKGLVLLTAPSGCGKTTLSRMLPSHLPEGTLVTFIILHRASPGDILEMVARKLGFSDPSGSVLKITKEIEERLLVLEQDRQRFVLVIDEAQAMSDALFDEIMLLSNLETERAKLVQIVLMGRRRLLNLMNQPDLNPLKQRVAMVKNLSPLTEIQTVAYLAHRLGIAGGNPELITSQAGHLIFMLTGGVPRLVNKLADASLLSAYLAGDSMVDVGAVQEGAAEINLVVAKTGWWLKENPLQAKSKELASVDRPGLSALEDPNPINPSGNNATDPEPFLPDQEISEEGSWEPEIRPTEFLDPAPSSLIPEMHVVEKASQKLEEPAYVERTAARPPRKHRFGPLGFLVLIFAAMFVGGYLSMRELKSETRAIASKPLSEDVSHSVTHQIKPPYISETSPGASPKPELTKVLDPKSVVSPFPADIQDVSPEVSFEKSTLVSSPQKLPNKPVEDLTFFNNREEIPTDRPRHPFSIQVGSFLTRVGAENALRELDYYQSKGFWTKSGRGDSGSLYRVFTGAFQSREQAVKRWEALKIPNSMVVRVPYAVMAGLFDSEMEAGTKQKELTAIGLSSYIQEWSGFGFALLVGGFHSREDAKKLVEEHTGQSSAFQIIER